MCPLSGINVSLKWYNCALSPGYRPYLSDPLLPVGREGADCPPDVMDVNLDPATGVGGSVHECYPEVPLPGRRQGAVGHSDSSGVAVGHAPAALVTLVERGLRPATAEVVKPDGGRVVIREGVRTAAPGQHPWVPQVSAYHLGYSGM